MALMTLTFESRYLRSNQAVTVVLPEMPRALEPAEFYARRRDLKVVWLLHGTFGDHTDWVRKTNVELYALEKGVAVVMPSALNSNYSNWSDSMLGYDMYDYLTEELMPLVYNWLPVSDRREDNFIAGLSMGGRGAVKFAVNHPEKFAAAAVLSAAPIDYAGLTDAYLSRSGDPMAARLKGMVDNAGGLAAFVDSEENVWRIIDEAAASGALPRLLFACGADDSLIYDDLLAFRDHATQIGLDAEFWIREGYGHEWRFWDLAIQKAFDFFGLEDTVFNPF
jgi:S-formylglutathione hydrolase FrmB